MKTNKQFFFVFTVTIFLLSIPKTVYAQERATSCSISDFELSENQAKEKETTPSNQNSPISSEKKRVAVAGLSIPSLWWAREQFDPFGGKLIDNWLAHPNIKQIDLTVNWQLWTLLDYLGRYRFLNQFGTVAREYGYDLRVFNQQKQCLGIYEYNPTSNPPKWEIKLESSGQDSLQLQPINN